MDLGRRLDVAGFVDQIMRQLHAAHAARFHRIQPVKVAFQEVTALDRQDQGRVVGPKILRLAGDAGAGLLETGQVALNGLQALARIGIAEFLQPAGVPVAPDHRDIANRRYHRRRDPGRAHGGQHGPVHITGAPGPACVGVHVDNHGCPLSGYPIASFPVASMSVQVDLARSEAVEHVEGLERDRLRLI